MQLTTTKTICVCAEDSCDAFAEADAVRYPGPVGEDTGAMIGRVKT